ncbi:MAG: hypothetical protein ILP16_04685, partial [Spirochaetales bacterium]|nr:hypothetical protein [Spirochaetales bacterium]
MQTKRFLHVAFYEIHDHYVLKVQLPEYDDKFYNVEYNQGNITPMDDAPKDLCRFLNDFVPEIERYIRNNKKQIPK